jgi:uncharacterized protein YraI
MKRNHIALAAATALIAMSGAAMAATAVTATTDLNVRAGPGPEHPVIGMIGAGEAATLEGCLEGSKWCTVATSAGAGWVYSDYLTSEFGGQAVVLTDRPADSGVQIVPAPTTDGQKTGAIAGGATGAIAGAIIGGPIGAVVGGAAGALGGASTGTIIDPPGTVRTYVTGQQVDPVYLDGEVVVGAQLPDTVELREVPDYQYRYVYVNGQRVLVEPDSLRIVYIVR